MKANYLHQENSIRVQKKRYFFTWSRWLHIYLSTALLALLIFFCITGVTLNHVQWLNSDSSQNVNNFPIPEPLLSSLNGAADIPIEQIKTFVSSQYGLKNPRSIDMDLELQEVSLDFPLPAGYVFITFFIKQGILEVEHKQGSVWLLLNDLHKGRHSGSHWSLFIDLSAISIILISLTGLLVLLQQKKRRMSALISVLAGTITPLIIYLGWVPQYGNF